jgi:hypothetical protein
MDIVTAFHNTDIVSDIYMEQTESYHPPSSTGTRLICKLSKALYVIHEAPRAWNILLSGLLISFGFSQSVVDPAISIITINDLLHVLVLYVDDSTLFGCNAPFILNFKTAFPALLDI